MSVPIPISTFHSEGLDSISEEFENYVHGGVIGLSEKVEFGDWGVSGVPPGLFVSLAIYPPGLDKGYRYLAYLRGLAELKELGLFVIDCGEVIDDPWGDDDDEEDDGYEW